MSVAKLKKIAKENNIPFDKDAGADSLIETLRDAGIPVSDSFASASKTTREPSENVNLSGLTDEISLEFKFLTQKYTQVLRLKDNPNKDLELTIIKKDLNNIKQKAKDNESLYRKILQWERSRNMINVQEDYYLNELEANELDYNCQCILKMVAGRKVQVGQECKYKSYYDESRSADVFIIYTERVIEPEQQISKELDRKIRMGFMPTEEDYEPPKTVWHRFTLVDREFYTYFKTLD